MTREAFFVYIIFPHNELEKFTCHSNMDHSTPNDSPDGPWNSRCIDHDIDERDLQEHMYYVGDHEDSLMNYRYFWAHKDALKAGTCERKEYTRNPFIREGYHVTDIANYLFPIYCPNTHLAVVITSVRQVFEGRCAVAFCRCDNTRLCFFDPNPDMDKYMGILNMQTDIRLAAISCGEMFDYPVVSDENELTDIRFDYLGNIVFEGNFEVIGMCRSRQGFIILLTKNPFDCASDLELLTNEVHIDDKVLPKVVGGWFFLIGSLK